MRTFEIIGIVFGCLFFAGHLIRAGFCFRAAQNRAARLEAIGAAVPGFAGVLLVLSIVVHWLPVKLALLLAAMPVMVVGRACYELIIFARGGPQT